MAAICYHTRHTIRLSHQTIAASPSFLPSLTTPGYFGRMRRSRTIGWEIWTSARLLFFGHFIRYNNHVSRPQRPSPIKELLVSRPGAYTISCRCSPYRYLSGWVYFCCCTDSSPNTLLAAINLSINQLENLCFTRGIQTLYYDRNDRQKR